jgi:hypothetical protein
MKQITKTVWQYFYITSRFSFKTLQQMKGEGVGVERRNEHQVKCGTQISCPILDIRG